MVRSFFSLKYFYFDFKYSYITVYSNTNIFLIYRLICNKKISNELSNDEFEIKVINSEYSRTDEYIIDCEIIENSDSNLDKKQEKEINSPIIRFYTM